MGNITKFPGTDNIADGGPNEAVVRVLETALEEAKAGRITGLVYTGTLADGGRITGHATQGVPVFTMLGCIQALAYEYMRREIE